MRATRARLGRLALVRPWRRVVDGAIIDVDGTTICALTHATSPHDPTSNAIATTSDRGRSDTNANKTEKGRRRRRYRWDYKYRKNRVTLLVDPNIRAYPAEESIERFIGKNEDHIKALTECYDGAFAKVEKEWWSGGADYFGEREHTGRMRIQISALNADSLLKCRQKTLTYIYRQYIPLHPRRGE